VSNERVRHEEFRVDGDELLAKIKEIVREGNVRRITFKNEQGETLIEIPLTLGVVLAIAKPVLVAIGAIGAMLGHLTVVVEKVESPAPKAEQ
jgi:hypothetical protein